MTAQPAAPPPNGRELAPCPFCGSTDAYTEKDMGVTYVRCPKCVCFGPDCNTKAAAIAAWNTRPAAATVDAELVALLRQAIWTDWNEDGIPADELRAEIIAALAHYAPVPPADRLGPSERVQGLVDALERITALCAPVAETSNCHYFAVDLRHIAHNALAAYRAQDGAATMTPEKPKYSLDEWLTWATNRYKIGDMDGALAAAIEAVRTLAAKERP